MGCECCKSRLEATPTSLPSKSRKVSSLVVQGKQLSQDFQTLLNNIQAPKGAGDNPQSLWTVADLKMYGEFLAKLVKQVEELEQNPVIQVLGLPTEGLEAAEVSERCRAMESFIAQLRSMSEPGDLPDAQWLEAVKQLVAKKTVFLACKKRYEQLQKQFQDYRANSGNVPQKDILVIVDKGQALQTQVGQTMDGYFTIIQRTERVFQAISFLSRVAMGMQARLDALSGQSSVPTDTQPPQVAVLEMEVRDREQAEAPAA